MKQPTIKKTSKSKTNPSPASTTAVPTTTNAQASTMAVPIGTIVVTPSVATAPTVTGGVTLTTSAATDPIGSAPNPTPTPTGTVPAATAGAPSVATATTAATPTDADPPPNVTIPLVPIGFVAQPMKGFRGFYPSSREQALIPKAVTDIGNFADYATVLGNKATSPSTFASTLTAAVQWRTLRNASEAWTAYVKAQDALAWKAAFAVIDEVKPLFLFAATKSTLATTYPWLAALFNAPTAIAKEASATKAKNAKAAKAAGTGTTTAGVATATVANAATGAGAGAAVVAAPVPKTVTVNA